MILVKVVELIINKDRRCHWLGNFEGESAVGVDVADVVVSDPNLLDLVGKDDHWYSDCEEDEGEREEECYCLGRVGTGSQARSMCFFNWFKKEYDSSLSFSCSSSAYSFFFIVSDNK